MRSYIGVIVIFTVDMCSEDMRLFTPKKMTMNKMYVALSISQEIWIKTLTSFHLRNKYFEMNYNDFLIILPFLIKFGLLKYFQKPQRSLMSENVHSFSQLLNH